VTLTARLSLFFLGTLAVVLVGFSGSLYGLAHTYLYRQMDDRLEAALDVLAATAEIKAGGVEWEAEERPVSLAAAPGAEPVAWLVRDDRGRMLDGSRDPGPRESLLSVAPNWRIRTRQLSAGPNDKSSADEPEDKSGAKYAHLTLAAGLPLEPTAASLRNLLLVLGGLSGCLWLAAALAGGRLCRRALAPVRRMADAASAMNAADPTQRLPAITTGDELEELNRSFNQLLSRLQESFERQRRFTGDASHQLRTPLTSLLGHVEVALRRPRPAEEYQQVLAVVRDQTLRMRQMVEMLLFLARADAEAQSPPLERVDVRAWLADHLASWPAGVRAADLRCETSGDGPLWVPTQTALLGQLFDNLLDNACKYSPPGTPITVGLAEKDGAVVLSVTDAGRGIAEQDLPHIFEPFYRSRLAHSAGTSGVGLGLAVARRIAPALGGTLHVDSQPGCGSCFTLQLVSDAS
jgi:heavy metal sensor kinase